MDLRGTLATLGAVPVLVLAGEKDRLISPSLGVELAAQIPGAQLVLVPGAGARPYPGGPNGVVNEAITRLIARAEDGRGCAGAVRLTWIYGATLGTPETSRTGRC